MQIEIDMDGVDSMVVDQIILALCETMMNADHIDPSVDECVVALSRMIEIVLDDEADTLVH